MAENKNLNDACIDFHLFTSYDYRKFNKLINHLFYMNIFKFFSKKENKRESFVRNNKEIY